MKTFRIACLSLTIVVSGWLTPRVSADDGFTLWGDYHLTADSSLTVNSGVIQIAGDFDVAINDSDRFDLRAATLQFIGINGAGPYDIETLATDGVCDAALPDQAIFSIRRLRIGPGGVSVRLVDNHDNSAGSGREALYVEMLVQEANTSLDLRGHRLYYGSIVVGNNVTVTDSIGGGDLVLLGSLIPADPTDPVSTPSELCFGDAIDLSATVDPGLLVDWTTEFCGGASVGTGNPLTGEIPMDTPFTTFYARARDPVSGCISSGCATVVVTVNALPLCGIDTVTYVCEETGSYVASVASAVEPAIYTWTVANGTIDSGQGTPNIIYSAASGAVVTIDVAIEDDNGCVCASQIIVPIEPNPDCMLTAETVICYQSGGHTASVAPAFAPANYVWTVIGGTITDGQGTPAITYSSDDGPTLTIDVLITDGNGCICTSQHLVTVNKPDCTITSNTQVCTGVDGYTATVPDGGAGATYAWIVTGGMIDSGQGTREISYTPGSPGSLTIDVTVTDNIGCVCNGQHNSTIDPSPDCTITTDAVVCSTEGDLAASVPDAGPGATYVWIINGGVISSGQGTPMITFTAGPGPNITIDVTVTSAINCISTCQTIVNMDQYQWTGPDGGSFINSGNWTPNGVPGDGTPGGDAFLTNTGGVDNTCVLDAPGQRLLCGLRVEASGSGKQYLRIDSGAVLATTTTTTIEPGGEVALAGGELSGGTITNTGNSLTGYGRVSADLDNAGLVRTDPLRLLELRGGLLTNRDAGMFRAALGSGMLVRSPIVDQSADIEVQVNATIVFSNLLTNRTGGRIILLGGAVGAPELTNDVGGQIDGFGTIQANLNNDGALVSIADTVIVGDVANEGIITIQNGLLTITGTLSGSGTIIGGFGGRDGDNDAATGLLLYGNLDLSGTDPAQLDLSNAIVQFDGGFGRTQSCEAMSPDVDTIAGQNLGSHAFTIGTLRVGPSPGTVQLLDRRDNKGAGSRSRRTREALYVRQLILEPGVTLDLAGLRLYYEAMSPENLVTEGGGVSVIDSVGGGRLIRLNSRQGP